MTQNQVFNQLMAIAGWPAQSSSHITITGQDPVLPTRFRVGVMAAGIHAACGAAVAKLWELQTGRWQKVEVNVRAAAASLNSFLYMRRPTPDASLTTIQSERGQLSMMEFFRTKDDRWIFLHAGRDHFHDNALKLLRCQESIDSIAAAISQWEAQPLEDALNAGGCMGVIARSIEEWNEHPQGKVLRNLPVVEVIKVGDSPPEPLGRGDRPLSGVRVLDVTNVLSGPTCGRTLAEHGADVLRVDSPSEHIIAWHHRYVYVFMKLGTSNAIAGLSSTGVTATFSAKSTVKELDGHGGSFINNWDAGAILQINLSKVGGVNKMSITVEKSSKNGGLWYSSQWDGKKTVLDTITGGSFIIQ